MKKLQSECTAKPVLKIFFSGVIFCLGVLGGVSCTRTPTELPVIPPPTYPLSRQYIGYGVVDAAYIQVLDEPAASGLSLGHLRRGSLVKILERRISAGKAGPWVLIEGAYRGWLPEGEVQIFDNEAKAQTAAEYMTQ